MARYCFTAIGGNEHDDKILAGPGERAGNKNDGREMAIMTFVPDENRATNAVSETSETSEVKAFLEPKI